MWGGDEEEDIRANDALSIFPPSSSNKFHFCSLINCCHDNILSHIDSMVCNSYSLMCGIVVQSTDISI